MTSAAMRSIVFLLLSSEPPRASDPDMGIISLGNTCSKPNLPDKYVSCQFFRPGQGGTEHISQNNLEKDEDYGKNQTANQKMRLQLIIEVYEFLHNALPFTNKTETLLRSVFLNRVYDVLAICGFPVLIHWSHLIRKCLALLCRKLGQLHSFLLQLFKIFVVII